MSKSVRPFSAAMQTALRTARKHRVARVAAAKGGNVVQSKWSLTDNTGPVNGNTMTVSNGGRTAKHTAGAGNGGVRTDIKKTSGKLHAEIVFDHLGAGAACALSNSAGSITSFNNSTGQILVVTGGNIIINNASTISGGSAYGTGGIVVFEVDFVANRAWARNSTDAKWNNNVAANPATGVGGIDISAFVSDGFMLFFGNGNQTDQATINTETAQFVTAVSSGFKAWDH